MLIREFFLVVFFFFQAEDGIRDIGVTGVQTCALPISPVGFSALHTAAARTSLESEAEGCKRRESTTAYSERKRLVAFLYFLANKFFGAESASEAVRFANLADTH